MTRLAILSEKERRVFENPPKLKSQERQVYFDLSLETKKILSAMTSDSSKVGFILQLGYFRMSGRFYAVEKFRQTDIRYVSRLLKVPMVKLMDYSNRSVTVHRHKILNLLGWSEADEAATDILYRFAKNLANNQAQPRDVFFGLLDLCWKYRWIIPSYRMLSVLVTDSYNEVERDILEAIQEHITPSQLDCLKALVNETVYIGKRKYTRFSQLKQINQALRPKDIQADLEAMEACEPAFRQCMSLLNALPLTDVATQRYAAWFQKADHQQISQFIDPQKTWLFVLCFLKDQFFKHQDAFVDVLLKSVTSARQTVNSALWQADEENRKKRNKAIEVLSGSHRNYAAFAKEIIKVVNSPLSTPNEKYNKIEELVHALDTPNAEEQLKIKEAEDLLNSEVNTQAEVELQRKQSNPLQRRVSKILMCLEFDTDHSDPTLLAAINYFKLHDGRISGAAPLDFLTVEELKVITEDNGLDASLYKYYLFFHVATAIKSGTLNLLHSYRYRAILTYLISKIRWQSEKDTILQATDMQKFSDGEAYLEFLKEILDRKFHTVNKRLLKKKNKYFYLDRKGRPAIRTPATATEDDDFISSTLAKDGYVSILDVMRTVTNATNFTKEFHHLRPKSVKMNPADELFFAGIIGKGCNIGIGKMAGISNGVNSKNLDNTVNWFFSLDSLRMANTKIREGINSMELASQYISTPHILRSSSDGRKITTAVDSLHANYSYKYFGHDKGVTGYTFIDERQALFYSTVFSSSDREAPYVLDGLLSNKIAEKQIHSTDTFGFSETLFTATHMSEVEFAPRFKSLPSQQLYGFTSKNTYAKKGYPLLPSRTIDRKLILDQWDNILRFMASIRSNHATASQLFKRLSSYAKEHPLYKALKEFGRIIKTHYILTYYDDLELRQQVQKQLNRIELSNRFGREIFFDNDQAFQDGGLEDQQMAIACQVIIQNCIVFWNYLYLSNEIINTEDPTIRMEMIASINRGSVLCWRSVNLRGTYDFTKKAANDPRFDINKLRKIF